MNKRGATSTIGIILILIVFLIVFVTGIASMTNVASDVSAQNIHVGIPALFFNNLTFWILTIFIMAILWMVFSG